MNVHSVSLKGRRESNEDKHVVFLNENNKDQTKSPVNIFGVFDGHGGKYVSKYLSDNIINLLTERQIKFPLSRDSIFKLYDCIQVKLRQQPEAQQCGSTCLIAIVFKIEEIRYINVMNTGDSRSVLCRDNLALALTKDHKPNWPEEKQRIQALGGCIYFDGDDYRVKDLSVSRAFGDVKAEPYVTHRPDIFRYRLEKADKFIVIACDGLWDKLSNQDVVNFVLSECYDMKTNRRLNTGINVAKKLGEYAIHKGSTDNITIIIVFLD